jgi:predicted nucleotidyltransferase
MSQDELIRAIAAALADQMQLRGLFLVGSFGKGTADAFSDIDLLAIVEEAGRAEFPAVWRATLEGIAPVVFWNQRPIGGTLINAITEDWTRCDLVIPTEAGLRGLTKDRVRVLIDRDGLYDTLPPHLAYGGPNVGKVTYLINEFIRVLGLLSVGMGRGEYFLGTVGAGMLRDHLSSLMVEETAIPDPGGALHLSRLLSPDQMQVLTGLPFPRPERTAIIEAHLATARAFMPRARALAAKLDIPWPQTFEEATLRHLRRRFGEEFDVSW